MVNWQRLFKIKKLWHTSKKVWRDSNTAPCFWLYIELCLTYRHTATHACVFILCCPSCFPYRTKWEGWRCHVAGKRLASPYPPAWDGPPGWDPLHRPHGQQDLHQHQLAVLQRVVEMDYHLKKNHVKLVTSSSALLGNYIVLCKSFLSLFTRAHKLSSHKKSFGLQKVTQRVLGFFCLVRQELTTRIPMNQPGWITITVVGATFCATYI